MILYKRDSTADIFQWMFNFFLDKPAPNQLTNQLQTTDCKWFLFA